MASAAGTAYSPAPDNLCVMFPSAFQILSADNPFLFPVHLRGDSHLLRITGTADQTSSWPSLPHHLVCGSPDRVRYHRFCTGYHTGKKAPAQRGAQTPAFLVFLKFRVLCLRFF